jgi:AcrR family transcriptional regulator
MNIELDNTEEKIVTATFSIVQKEGFTKATTKKIAAEAGVNEVTIFRKFENKNNLIEITKEYYTQKLIGRLEEIFGFTGDEEIEEYLQNNFVGLLNLQDSEFSVIKVAMEEVREIPDKKLLISKITDTILDRIEAFFKLQIEKGKIRQVDPRVLAVVSFSTTFQSIVLWNVYNLTPSVETQKYAENYLDILFNGIK